MKTNKEEMFKIARDKLMTKGFKFYSECDRYILFRNWALSITLKFDKKNPSYIVYDTITGQAVFVSWGLQKAITELFKVYDYKAMGLIQFMCEKLKITKEQLATRIPISVAILNKGEKNIYTISEKSLEKIINYAEQKGLELWKETEEWATK